MTAALKNVLARLRLANGSMMLEYTIVQVGIGIALFTFAETQFYSSLSSSFGPVGRDVCNFYKRIQAGVSLPVP